MEKVLIAGCGRIGSQLGLKLAESGYSVWGIRRHGLLATPMHTLNANLSEIKQLDQHFDYIVYCCSADDYTREAYQAAYVTGLKQLISILPNQPKKFIFTSSTSVYGQSQGEPVDESSITKPYGFAGKYLLEAEDYLLAQHFQTVTVRFSGIYGTEYNHFFKQVLNRKVELTAKPVITNRIHSEDCVRVLEFLLKHPDPDRLYLASDSMPIEKNTLIHWLEAQLELPHTQRVTDKIPRRGNKRCINKKLLASGFVFKYPSYIEGYGSLMIASASI